MTRTVQVEYSQKADAMCIWLKKAKKTIKEELAENVIINLDKNGQIIDIEVLDELKTGERNLSEFWAKGKQP